MGAPNYQGIFDYKFVSNPDECTAKLPPTLAFGNSFTDFWWSVGLQNYFCSIQFSRFTLPVSRFPAFAKSMPAGTKFLFFKCLLTDYRRPPDLANAD